MEGFQWKDAERRNLIRYFVSLREGRCWRGIKDNLLVFGFTRGEKGF
jgi:hypothetical protein